MKIFVTGATGMVGRNLIFGLSTFPYEIFKPDRDTCDLECQESVLDYVCNIRPDMIIHCAGLVGGIHVNMKTPFEFFQKNMLMGMNIINAAVKNSTPRFLNLGSSCMYPKDITPLAESDLFKGAIEFTNEGYGLAKLATAKLTEICNRQFRTDYKTLIPCNLFGKWDKFDPEKSHMIPAVIRKIHHARVRGDNTCEIWGDGTGRREFMYVEDLVDFIKFAIHNYELIPVYCNVGTGTDYTIFEYHQIVAKIIGFEGKFVHDLSKPSGVTQRLLDIQQQTKLGWHPKHSIHEGIEKTYTFFREQFG